MEAVAAYALGRRLTPAQRLIVDTATELLPDGRYAYPVVVVTTPRQVGKTTLELAIGAYRTLTGGRVAYTAQTGQVAREKWREMMGELPPKLAPPRTVRLSNGSESWSPTHVGSRGKLWPFPPNRDALHGTQTDLAILDELWSLDELEGDALLTAVKPTQQTRKRPQVWMVSTAGDPRSVWWRAQVDAGRAAVEADTGRGVAFFEWAAPDDDAVFTPETWPDWHPGVGHLFPVETVPDLLAGMPRDEALRSFGNLWRAAIVSGWPPGSWEASIIDAPDPMPAVAALSMDVAPGRESASIGAGHLLPDDRALCQLLATGQGTGWMGPMLADLSLRFRVPVLYDAYGQSAAVVQELEQRLRGVTFLPVDTRGFIGACGGHLDAVVAGNAVHLHAPELDLSAQAAVRKVIGDRWAWSRTRSAIDATPLVAVALAWRGAVMEEARPQVYVRGA